MARLIDLSAQERPTPRVGGGARIQPAPVSDAVGRGLQELGRGIELGAEEAYGIQKAEQDRIAREAKVEEERINTLRAEEAFTQLRNRQLDLSVGEQNGFTKIRGAQAVSRPLLKEWGKRFDDAQTEIAGSLANDAQRVKFRQRAGVARLQFDEEILRHLAKEGDTYAKEVFDGTINTEQRNAVARWDSPNDVELSLDRIRAAVQDRAERYNWPTEYRDAVLREEQGKVHAAVIEQAIATGNYRYGQKWYEANRQNIDLATAKQLERAVEDGTQKELTATYNAQYLQTENERRGLEALRRTVLEDKSLGEDRRNILVGRIQNRVSVLEHRAEVAEAKRLRVIERGLSELNASTLAGFEPTQAQFAPLMNAAKGTELESDVRRAIGLANATRSFRNATPLNQEQLLASAEARLRTEPDKVDRRLLGAWRQIYESQRRQVTEAPVSFAVQQGIVEAPRPLDLSNPIGAGSALAERFAIARGISSRYQAPFKPLTPEEVTLLKTTLAGASVEQKRNYFAGLAQATGNDMQGYRAIMAQIAPDDPVTAIAGVMAARGHQTDVPGGQRGAFVSDLMLQGQRILQPPRKEDGQPAGGKLLPMPSEKDMQVAFDNTVRDAFAGMPQARSDHYQAARAIYAKLASDAGDKDTSVLDSDRWEQSIKLATGGIEKWNGKRIVMPWGFTSGQFKDGLYRRIDDLVASGALPKEMTAGKLRDMPLEAIGDGRYVFRAGDGVLAARPSYNKAIIENPDGSISTERTITVEADGKHFLVPTIVAGKEVSQDQAVKLWQEGKNKAVGEFATAQEAERAATARSEAIGRALQPRPIIIDFNQSPAFRSSGQR